MNKIKTSESEEEFVQLRVDIDTWAVSTPIATEQDILELRPKLKYDY
ncbi:hypothetical protein [Polaribacter atrinae]|nr:hypothetical protein [Polaribacter atrinae]